MSDAPPRKLKRPPTSGTRHGTGPAKGAGYGGAARGAHDVAAPTWDRAHVDQMIATRMAQTQEQRSAARERTKAQASVLLDHIADLALTAERDDTRLAASKAYIERVEGLSIARTITATVTDPDQLTDADLAAIAAGSGAAAADKATDQG